MYEITEKMIGHIRKLNKQHIAEKKQTINITPADCEWVIDIFEKTFINDTNKDVNSMIVSFRDRAPLDVQQRVDDYAIREIFMNFWKPQLEKRKNKSFIREFWCYKDGDADGDQPTFKATEQKNRITTR